jgi:hypothetical protein
MSPRRGVIPTIFCWLFPLQAPVAAVAIYASVYVFGAKAVPFILAVVAVSPASPVPQDISLTWTRLACMSSSACISASSGNKLGVLSPTLHLSGLLSVLASGAARCTTLVGMSPSSSTTRTMHG